jgi:hypothetical protein
MEEKFKDWYGPPIAVAGIPGRVYVARGGEFVGPIRGGYYASRADWQADKIKGMLRKVVNGWYTEQPVAALGFAGVADLQSKWSLGRRQVFGFHKNIVGQPATGAAADSWHVANTPAAGSAASTANGGTVYDNTSVGGFQQANAISGEQLYFVSANLGQAVAIGSAMCLFDKLFAVNRNYNSAAAQAITGVPTRYQTSTTAPGNIHLTNVVAALGATPANVTITYTDQDNNAAEAGPAQVIRINAAIDTNDLTSPLWFYLLNAGDNGLMKLTNFQLSAAMGTGTADRGIYHPIAVIPSNPNNFGVHTHIDGTNSAFCFERIYDGACLNLWTLPQSATTATGWVGSITLLSG